MPAHGFIASVSARSVGLPLPPSTTLVDQAPWTALGTEMGGLGTRGILRLTRGSVAACWAISQASPGETVILVGFDNIYAREALPTPQAFSEHYLNEPSTAPMTHYCPGLKGGNHDFAIERPLLERLAAERGVHLSFAQDVWT